MIAAIKHFYKTFQHRVENRVAKQGENGIIVRNRAGRLPTERFYSDTRKICLIKWVCF
jgi:hypothetical protein